MLINVESLAECIDNYPDAVHLLAFVEKGGMEMISIIPLIYEDYQELVLAAHKTLGQEEFKQHRSEGEQLTMDSAIELAMALQIE